MQRGKTLFCAYAPEVIGATIQIGHHAIIDGQECVVAPPRGLQHGEDVNGPPLALADGVGSRHSSPQARVGSQRIPRATGNQAERGPDALLPLWTPEIPLCTIRNQHSLGFVIAMLSRQTILLPCGLDDQ